MDFPECTRIVGLHDRLELDTWIRILLRRTYQNRIGIARRVLGRNGVKVVHIDQDETVWHPFVSGAGAKGENALGSGGFRIVFVDDNVVVEIIDAFLEIVFKDEFSQRIMRELDVGFLYRGHVHMAEPTDLGAFCERGADGIKEFDGVEGVVGSVLDIEDVMGEIAGFDQGFALRILLDIAPSIHLVGGGFAVKGS